jgi:hypothetical protein
MEEATRKFTCGLTCFTVAQQHSRAPKNSKCTIIAQIEILSETFFIQKQVQFFRNNLILLHFSSVVGKTEIVLYLSALNILHTP